MTHQMIWHNYDVNLRIGVPRSEKHKNVNKFLTIFSAGINQLCQKNKTKNKYQGD